MRMDPGADVSAAGIVNEAAERDLATIFKRYGEERYARQIAKAIARRRKEQPFERTGDLVETIKAAIPAPARFGEGHPAKRVFQALRIAVNDELGSLEAALPSAFAMLRPGGRLAVISFHSLEDRIVKRFMRDRERGCDCPPDFPVCVCGKTPELRSTSRKAIRPSAAETAANPRSSSGRCHDRGSTVDQVYKMAAWAAAARAEETVAVPRSRTRVVKRERRVTGGVFWIGIVATLLAGVVATNVAVLRLNMKLDSLGRERADLRAQNAELSSQLSSAASAPRIQRLAAKRLGLVQAPSDQMHYFNLQP